MNKRRAALLAALTALAFSLGGCFLSPDPTLDPLAIDPNQTPIPYGPTAQPTPTPAPTSSTSGGWESWVPVQPTAQPTPTPVVAQPTATPSSWETSTDDYYAGYPVLRVGSTGSDVSDMQTRLQELGYYTGEIDGRFAGGTQAAVEAFQTANGLTADGIAGRQTQDLLYSTSAVPKTITATDDQDGYALLKAGSYGTEVRKLQARLTELGYYAGGVDGVYGEATEDAVKAFQRQNNLSGDGQAGEATQSKLYSDSAKENSRPVTTANPNETRSLSIGMEGNDVYSVQEYLIKLGYLTGVADGVFGAETEDAVILFQQRNGLEDDGVVGSATLRKLSSSSAKKGPLASATATPEPGEYVTLREGDSGTLVYDLQERLYELGYYEGRIDGRFGAGTTQAVVDFQRENGLDDDGIAGRATQNLLFSSDAKFNPNLMGGSGSSATATPAPATSEVLRLGSTGEAVRSLQTALRSLGYYSGEADGDFGESTQAAVRLFQTYNGISADGIAGARTFEALYGGNATPFPGTGQDADDDDEPDTSQTLKEGDVSEAVRLMQKRLYALGYLPEYLTDGDYGERTVEAVKEFQRMNGLTQDGIAGPGTLALIYSDDAVPYGGATELDALQTGSQGDEVAQMQRALADVGCYTGTADGVFGETTHTAVQLFQAFNGLTPDGVAGRDTLALLYSDEAKGARSDTLTDLASGATGANVTALQVMLRAKEFLDEGQPLGTYDAQTAAAVVRFQGSNGLEQTGIATVATQTLLYGQGRD